jgi:ribosomal protein S20
MKVEQQNRLINKRYKTIVKNLLKLFKFKLKELKSLKGQSDQLSKTQDVKEPATLLAKKINQIFIDLTILRNNLFSAFDKATKKNIIHSNRANKKKHTLNIQYTNCQLLYYAIKDNLAFN